MEASKLSLFLIAFAAILPPLKANIVDFDHVWKARAERAAEAALRAYEPEPSKVTNKVNEEVRRTLESINSNETLAMSLDLGSNSTRRDLRGKIKRHVKCIATNPIDRCWRCDRDWEPNRKRLAECGLGFGHKAVGGKDGRIYVVTDESDDPKEPKPGTLRHAVIQKEPLWIIFGGHIMKIVLRNELMVQSHKTIDGRGSHVEITGCGGVVLQYVENVIIHNVRILNMVPGKLGLVRDSVDHIGRRSGSDGDGVSVFGSTNVWLDHLSMSNCNDGLIDVIRGSTAVTISNCHFTDHNKVMLFGANDAHKEDKKMQITVAFNHFGKRLIQRMPRCRLGLIHVVNNDYTHWLMYAIGGSANPTIISQGNRFIAANPKKAQVTKREDARPSEWKNWIWRSQGDLMMNGAYFVESGNPKGAEKVLSGFEKEVNLPMAAGTAVTTVTRFTGALPCVHGRPC